jgi:hypothetical protein
MCTTVSMVGSGEPRAVIGPELRVAELWGQLHEEDRLALLSALGDGLLDARWAVQEMTQPESTRMPVVVLLASLNRAIQELRRARELLAVSASAAALRHAPSPSLVPLP